MLRAVRLSGGGCHEVMAIGFSLPLPNTTKTGTVTCRFLRSATRRAVRHSAGADSEMEKQLRGFPESWIAKLTLRAICYCVSFHSGVQPQARWLLAEAGQRDQPRRSAIIRHRAWSEIQVVGLRAPRTNCAPYGRGLSL